MYLYIRMLFNMGVSLYTSRVVLKVLGVEDYGIYNLVGGIVILFSFLNGAMSGATQRFINFERATNNKENVKKIFNISLLNHLLIALGILLLSETFGLWFLNYRLNIPSDRVYAANVVYQLTILTALIDIMRIPFNAMIIAYEKMSYFAFLGIFETIMKLIVVVSLLWIEDFDNLILYGILIMVVNLITNIIYFNYCKKNFNKETEFHIYKDKEKLKELFSFSSWLLIEQLAYVGNTQGLTMIVNLFFGVIGNAAAGIANQVNVAIYSFIRNFQTAFHPQIVQTFASNSLVRHKDLILQTSKFSCFLLFILGIPFILYPKEILFFWLGNTVPDQTVELLWVIILCSIIEAIAGPFWMSATAIGKLKKYTLTLTSIDLLTIPIAYFFMKNNLPIVFIFIARLITQFLLQIFRYFYLNEILHFDKAKLLSYFKSILLVSCSVMLLYFLFKDHDRLTFIILIRNIAFCEFVVFISIFFFGINNTERLLVLNYLKKTSKNKW